MPIDVDSKLLSNELLHRVCHANQVSAGRPWSRMFFPTAKDEGKLSADREQLRSPREAYEKYVATRGEGSCLGAWGVTAEEFSTIGLSSYADPIPAGEPNGPNPAHALVDFTHLVDEEALNAAKIVHGMAIARNRLYPD